MTEHSLSTASAQQPGVATKLIALLEAVAAAEHGISVREVARDTGFDRSTVSRILSQLQLLGVVEQSSLTGRFIVGSRLAALGEMLHTQHSLWGVAEPVIRDLVERFDETCYLLVRETNKVRFRERIECQQAVRYVIEMGATSPLYAGAAGRAVLIGMDRSEIDRYLDSISLSAITDRTIVDRAQLQRRIAEDKARGYTLSSGERISGGHGIGAPIYRADGECIGSLLWTTPSSRWDPAREHEFAAAVQEAASELSRRLGHSTAA